MEFEGDAIYLHQDDYKHSIFKNGLWIDVSNDIQQKHADFDQKHVLVGGTFNAEWKGHMGLWSGSIQNISRCEARPSRQDQSKEAPSRLWRRRN